MNFTEYKNYHVTINKVSDILTICRYSDTFRRT